MNILYIDHYAGSISMGMEFRPFYFAREWQKLGHKVLIVAADYSHLRRTNPSIMHDFQIQNVDGVDFCWIKTAKYSGNGMKRACTLLEFCTKLNWHAAVIVNEFHPDAVISSSTYPLDTYPAQKIAKFAKARYVHEAHDLWPLTLIELAGWKENHPFIRMLAAAEKSAFSKSDAVVGLFEGQKKYMLEHGLQSELKFTHIPNGVVTDDWIEQEELGGDHLKLLKELKSQGKFIVCYLGGHAVSNALDVFLNAAKRMKNEDGVAFLMGGRGKNLKFVFSTTCTKKASTKSSVSNRCTLRWCRAMQLVSIWSIYE